MLGALLLVSAHALPDLKPAAEAKNTKGPIELTLRLFQTKIKADESLWGQIELKNIGKTDITVTDEMFFRPWEIPDQSQHKPIYVAVFDAAGKPVKPRSGPFDFEGRRTTLKLSEVDPEEDRKIGKMIDGWKKTGLSQEKIDQKLSDYSSKWGRKKKESEESSRNTQIAPGASFKSQPRAHRRTSPFKDEPDTLPVAQFTELLYYFDKPGKYTIRAVYDYRMSERLKKLIAPDETNIYVKTKSISFEVVP